MLRRSRCMYCNCVTSVDDVYTLPHTVLYCTPLTTDHTTVPRAPAHTSYRIITMFNVLKHCNTNNHPILCLLTDRYSHHSLWQTDIAPTPTSTDIYRTFREPLEVYIYQYITNTHSLLATYIRQTGHTWLLTSMYRLNTDTPTLQTALSCWNPLIVA